MVMTYKYILNYNMCIVPQNVACMFWAIRYILTIYIIDSLTILNVF